MEKNRTFLGPDRTPYDVPATEEDAFMQEMQGAGVQVVPAENWQDDTGRKYDVPPEEVPEFASEMQAAGRSVERVHMVRAKVADAQGVNVEQRVLEVPESKQAEFLQDYRTSMDFAPDREETHARVAAAGTPEKSAVWAGVKTGVAELGKNLVRPGGPDTQDMQPGSFMGGVQATLQDMLGAGGEGAAGLITTPIGRAFDWYAEKLGLVEADKQTAFRQYMEGIAEGARQMQADAERLNPTGDSIGMEATHGLAKGIGGLGATLPAYIAAGPLAMPGIGAWQAAQTGDWKEVGKATAVGALQAGGLKVTAGAPLAYRVPAQAGIFAAPSAAEGAGVGQVVADAVLGAGLAVPGRAMSRQQFAEQARGAAGMGRRTVDGGRKTEPQAEPAGAIEVPPAEPTGRVPQDLGLSAARAVDPIEAHAREALGVPEAGDTGRGTVDGGRRTVDGGTVDGGRRTVDGGTVDGGRKTEPQAEPAAKPAVAPEIAVEKQQVAQILNKDNTIITTGIKPGDRVEWNDEVTGKLYTGTYRGRSSILPTSESTVGVRIDVVGRKGWEVEADPRSLRPLSKPAKPVAKPAVAPEIAVEKQHVAPEVAGAGVPEAPGAGADIRAAGGGRGRRGAVGVPSGLENFGARLRALVSPNRGMSRKQYDAYVKMQNNVAAASLLGAEQRAQIRGVVAGLEGTHGRSTVMAAVEGLQDGAITPADFASRFGIPAGGGAMRVLERIHDGNVQREKIIAGWEGLPETLAQTIRDSANYQTRKYLRMALGSNYEPPAAAVRDAVVEVRNGLEEAVERLSRQATRLVSKQRRARLDIPRWMETGDVTMLAGMSRTRQRAATMLRKKYLELRRVIEDVSYRKGAVVAEPDVVAMQAASEDWVSYYLGREATGVGARGGLQIAPLQGRFLEGAFRALYGEITDPAVRQGMTAEAQARMIAQMTFFRKVVAEGEGSLWASMPEPGRRLDQRLGESTNPNDRKRYGNLAGKYVTPEFLRLIQGEEHSGSIASTVKALWLTPMTFQRTAKLFTPKTIARNYITSITGFALGNGDVFQKTWVRRFVEGHDVLRRFIGNDPDAIAVVRGLNENGVFTANANSSVADVRYTLGGANERVAGYARKIASAYAYIDFPTKYAAYMARMDGGMSPGEAAAHVARFYQDRTRTPELVGKFSRTGFADYLGYTYDSTRIGVNQARWAVESMRRGDPTPMLGFAMSRAIWSTLLAGTATGLLGVAKKLAIIGGDEDRKDKAGRYDYAEGNELAALRNLVPEYDGNMPMLLMRRVHPDGSVTRHYVVVGGQTAFPMEDAFIGAFQHRAAGQGVLSVLGQNLWKIAEPGMQINALVKVMTGEDLQGKHTPTGKGLLDVAPGKQDPDTARVARDAAIGLAMDYLPEFAVKMLRDLHQKAVKEEAGQHQVGIFARHERDAIDILKASVRLVRGYRIERSDANDMLRKSIQPYIAGLRQADNAISGTTATGINLGGATPDQKDRAETAQSARANYLRVIADRARDAQTFAPDWFSTGALAIVLPAAGLTREETMQVLGIVTGNIDTPMRKVSRPDFDPLKSGAYQQFFQ